MAVSFSAITLFDRRSFLLGAGSLFYSSLNTCAEDKLFSSKALFASCIKRPDGSFGAVLLDENYSIIDDIKLPQRGHDVVFNPVSEDLVIFARRPGNFAIVVGVKNRTKPIYITAPKNRHFYGHGVFSNDGKLLYASENDFENAVGKIGIYDVTNGFNRIGEFESFGVGPHEIILLGDGHTLVVANGGIETHPDFGRAKLNLATMQSSLVFMDVRDGRLLERYETPSRVQKLSIRHMVSNGEKSIVFGGQYQSKSINSVPLMGNCILGEGLNFWDIEPKLLNQFENYTGSLAITKDKSSVAISSPKGGIIGIFEASNGKLQKRILAAGFNGLAPVQNGFVSSLQNGNSINVAVPNFTNKIEKKFDFAFDNHLAKNIF